MSMTRVTSSYLRTPSSTKASRRRHSISPRRSSSQRGAVKASKTSAGSILPNKINPDLSSDDDDKDPEDDDDDDDSNDSKDEGSDGNGHTAQSDATGLSTSQSIRELRRIRQQLGTLDDLWLDTADLSVGSDSDVSEISDVWSRYGDPISPSFSPRVVKWNASRKNLSEKLVDRKEGSVKSKKRLASLGDAGKQTAIDVIVPGMSSVQVGKKDRDSIYYLDFSNHFKQCLKLARAQFEARQHFTDRRPGAAPDARQPPPQRKMGVLGRRDQAVDRSSNKKSMPTEGAMNQEAAEVKAGSTRTISPLASPAQTTALTANINTGSRRSTETNASGGLSGSKAIHLAATNEGLGPKWPKGMWDNMDGHWRMLMAADKFTVTPLSYNRLYDIEFRDTDEKLTFKDLETTRKKVMRWMEDSNGYLLP